jgi:hypothetical protein
LKYLATLCVLTACVQVPRDTASLESGSENSARCPVWASISPEGSVRSFQTTSSYESSTGVASQYVSEVVSITSDGDGVEVLLVVDGQSQSESWESYTYQTTSIYRCDRQGAWAVSSAVDSTLVQGGVTVESSAETVYTDSFIMPLNLELGDRWQSVFSGTTTTSAGSQSFSNAIDSEVTATDTITVGAGSFSALVISETFEDGRRSDYRVADGPGFLLSEEFELVGYSSR